MVSPSCSSSPSLFVCKCATKMSSSTNNDERQPLIGRRRSNQSISVRSHRTKSFTLHDDYGHSYGNLARSSDDEEEEIIETDATQDQTEEEDQTEILKPTPLPKAQILVLCIMRVSEPVAFLCILPFIPKMLRENLPHVPRSQIGYWAGLIESIFALVQFCTVFLWGRASDSIGRKPVLLIGLLGVGISMNMFGLAKTLPQMIIARSIAGFMNANISVLKSSLGELTDETNQARAFSLLPLCFAFGSMVGPALGGALSDPTEQFPFLAHSVFLKEYPYWLPCFCSSLFCLLGFVTGFFFLEETLPSKRKANSVSSQIDRRERDEEETLTSANDDQQSQSQSPPPLRQLLTKPVILTLANAGMINFMNICYIAVLPLFCDTPIELGGLSMNKAEIGYYLAANGVVTIVVQLLFFPRLERKWGGPLQTLRRCLLVLPLVFVCFILAHYAGKLFGKPAIVASLAVLLCIRGASSMMVVSSNLCVNNVVPHRSALGSINGLSQSLGSLARAIGPIASTSSFAFSITHLKQILDGQAVWIVFSLISIITWWLSARMQVPRRAAWRRSG